MKSPNSFFPLRFNRLTLFLLGFGLSACQEGNEGASDAVQSRPSIPVISYSVVNKFPHDPAAFTEGLEYEQGYIYESVGLHGRSDLRKYSLESGTIAQQHRLEPQYFAEGITIVEDKIYQLTYRERIGFIYRKSDFKEIGRFPIPTDEGWGMTNNGAEIIFGDGSDQLYFLDTANLQVQKTLSVFDHRGPVRHINELEWIKGYIYANQWQTEYILKIDPQTGEVVGRADFSDLRRQAGIPAWNMARSDRDPEVLNGIAYDRENDRVFITGKNWPHLFEIRFH